MEGRWSMTICIMDCNKKRQSESKHRQTDAPMMIDQRQVVGTIPTYLDAR